MQFVFLQLILRNLQHIFAIPLKFNACFRNYRFSLHELSTTNNAHGMTLVFFFLNDLQFVLLNSPAA